jgi:type IV pilus assembly protein PilA
MAAADRITRGGAMARPNRHRNGFTLIELLIVVVIMGLLAAIAVPKFAASKDKSKLAAIRSDIRNIMSAQEAYYIDYSTYTLTFPSNTFNPSPNHVITITADAVKFTVTASNPTISGVLDECTVTVGDGTLTDGKIACS